MDDQRLGAVLRAVRIRRGWRQADVASAARASDQTVSRIERGHADAMTLGLLWRVAAVLEVRLELVARSRAGDLDRIANARHAALAEAVLRALASRPGWTARPEVSFGIRGERGVIDILAWQAARRTLLVIELKTEIVDVGELLGVLDRKRRLAPVVAEGLGWRPVRVATWLIVSESMTNRRRVAGHASTFGAALPDDGRAVRRWLPDPSSELRAMSFFSDRRPGSPRSTLHGVRRVRRPRSR